MGREINVGIVGATGLVGETFLKLLARSDYDFDKVRLFASESSKGKTIDFRHKTETVEVLAPGCFQGLDVVFFSSGDDISKTWAPKAVEEGAIAIDNSAAFRMDPYTPLIVPEINFEVMENPAAPQIIANPNCSTIQLVMVLHCLKEFNITQVRVASYQSVSGAGREGIDDLKTQTHEYLTKDEPTPGKVFNPAIAFECQPVIGSLDEEGFCSEERKIMRETQKILDNPNIKVSASTVRVPTMNGHGESLWVTFAEDVDFEKLETTLDQSPFVRYRSSKATPPFHTFRETEGETDIFVSRLRRDPSFENTWMMWLVADNLYRGAAANGLLIAERIFDKLGQS